MSQQQQPRTVSINIEIPEALYESRQAFIEANPGWSAERFDQAATSLFLMQNAENQPHVNRAYLDSLFGATH